MNDLQAIADALTGGAVTTAEQKLDRFEKATKVILAASVAGALMSTIAVVVALTRK
jgi:hypothetical protein